MAEPANGSDDPYVTRATMFAKLNATDAARRATAWAGFQAKYAPIIGGFARKLGIAPHELDDVIQEVTMQFFEAAQTFSYDAGRGRFRGYLKTVTYRTIRDRFRKRGQAAGNSLAEIDVADPRIDQEWDAVWDRERLTLALEAVARRYDRNRTFQAFERHAMGGEEIATIAADMKMSVDSVYKSVQRVRDALREEVQRMEQQDGFES